MGIGRGRVGLLVTAAGICLAPCLAQEQGARRYLQAGTGETLRFGAGRAVTTSALGEMSAQACTSPQANLCLSGATAVCSFRMVLPGGPAGGVALDLLAGNPPEACRRLAGRYEAAP
ncbi:hypothetical protein M446_1836 [Methylobacterium sp. 4-46]|uniref:hypothetical protein n=1 Tax=unclassified Methylobacterium TaxID=2615210 RepID=UPI000152D0A1|nr:MULTISPECIES: hypothetical protein [Methylobacterium]ACA16320.1 hypothetical protein M446_1836 [Methylobacterium sp. 4-46]WFT82028.1 hypothetical protein QA634_09275 [Methylobacterium nodulans]